MCLYIHIIKITSKSTIHIQFKYINKTDTWYHGPGQSVTMQNIYSNNIHKLHNNETSKFLTSYLTYIIHSYSLIILVKYWI